MMQKVKRIPVTKEGFEKLKLELESLKQERPRAVKNLSEARNMGDLSENGLYTAAKARLRSIDNQIFRLEMQIKLADIADEKSSEVIAIGSKVEVSDGKSTSVYQIVGDYEASPIDRKISKNSPLGRVLMGKKKGEYVTFNAPKGEVSYKILKVF